MDFLKLKIPPPVIALLTAVMIWLLAHATPRFTFILPAHRILAICIFVLGLLTAGSGVASFRRARTTVNPMHPDRASSLVISGIFNFTRNPMYLGLLFGLLGWSVYLSHGLAFLLLPAFVLYLNHFQIAPEERALASMFGQDFVAYKSKVRRWL